MIEGVRFVESTEAKVFHAPDLLADARAAFCMEDGYVELDSAGTVTEGTGSKYRLSLVNEGGQSNAASSGLVGRSVLVNDVSEGSWQYAVVTGWSTAPGALYLYLDRPLVEGGKGSTRFSPTAEDMVYPGEAGLAGRDVYATLVMGDNAYGTTELSGGGLEHIVKQLGSAGTADPLNQRATVGWKATKAAARLVEAFMVRIETASTFEVGAN
ncbi:MAG: N4-gp56 family major capsid protein [Clostridia bacterium]|nr:N4-gp56 family major capsid protein [Clostridia bacterium]